MPGRECSTASLRCRGDGDVSTSLFSLARPPNEAIEELLVAQRELSVTYDHVGATREGGQPPAYRHGLWELDLGVGDAIFGRAREGVRCWAAHRGAGVEVSPTGVPPFPGETVVLVVPLAGLHVLAACRVVWTIDEDDRCGFAYGTLPGHPESGEAAFVVTRDPANRVVFEIRSFSRPAHPLARVGIPVTRWLQLRTTRRYLDAMAAWVSS